jgi:prolyl oligopeptidase
VAEGQSTGGSLVAAAVVQAPDRFGALLLAHPVVDMLRYERDRGAARRWRSEFGSVDDLLDFRALLAWSPLRNLRRGACYPPALIMPSEVDPVAAPWHGSKAFAAFAGAQGCARPVLLRMAWGAGHTYGKDVSDTIDSYADQLAFALAAVHR